MKRTLSLILALLMCLSMFTGLTVAAPQFSDVSEKDWFYNDVMTAVETGLINGKGNTGAYFPNDNLLYAEAVKLAACMHQRYTTGAVTLTNGNPWYQSYVDYAKANGIISKDYAWELPASRAGYMEIFAKALPADALPQINKVADGAIPDVPMTHVQSEPIYALYRAGILQGSGGYYCKPASNIQRSEVAAILTRMMDASARVSFSLGEQPEELTITQEIAEEVTVSAGEKVIATVGVDGGEGAYTYQWQMRTASGGWTVIAGADKATLTHTPTEEQLEAGLEYRCEITDGAGSKVYTRSLTPRKPVDTSAPVITTQPASVTCAVPSSGRMNMSFSVEVDGGKEPYTYQWQFRQNGGTWNSINEREKLWASDWDTDMLVVAVTDAIFDYEYDFRCLVTDADNKYVYSDAAELREETESLVVITQPASVTCAVPSSGRMNMSFSVEVDGGKEPYTYQWQFRLNGGTWNSINNVEKLWASAWDTDMLVVAVTDAIFDYEYDFRCLVTDADNQYVYSDAAALREKPTEPLTITTQPKDVTAAVGDTVTFSVAVSGGKEPYDYQWMWSPNKNLSDAKYLNYKNNFSGWTSASATGKVAADDFNTEFYVWCIVFDADGKSVTSSAAKLIDKTNGFRFYSQPQSLTIEPGENAKFQVEIEGGQYPYSFQWQAYGGVWADVRHVANVNIDVDEGYGVSLMQTKDTTLADHPMRVIVTDKNGNQLISDEFTITVKDEPLVITTQPQSVSCYAGETVTFTVAVDGGTPGYTYKWRFATISTRGVYSDVMDSSGKTTGQGTPQLTIKTTDGHITSGTTFVCVIKDQAGNTVESKVVMLKASEPPAMSAGIVPGEIEYDRRPYTCRVSGGVGPYTYSWKNQKGEYLGSSDTCWVYKDDNKNGKTTKVICTVTDSAGTSLTYSHGVWF